MPEFSSVVSVMKPERTLSKEELIRAVRLIVAAEYDTIQLFTQLVDSIEEPLAEKVLRQIARAKLVHVGEFIRLLYALHPGEHEAYEQGYAEVEELIVELEGV